MPTCFGQRAHGFNTAAGTIFHSNEKNQVQGQPLNRGLERKFVQFLLSYLLKATPVEFVKEQRS